MERLYRLLQAMGKAENVSKVLMVVMEQLQEVVNCHQTQFFLFTDDLLTEREKRVNNMQKAVVDGKYLDVFC